MATTCSTVLSWKGWGKDRRQRRQARRCTRPVKIRAQRGKKQEVEVGRRGWAEGSDKVTLSRALQETREREAGSSQEHSIWGEGTTSEGPDSG